MSGSSRNCTSQPSETGQHLLAKAIAVEAAVWPAGRPTRRYPATAGSPTSSPSAAQRVAFEIQWTAQTQDDYQRRRAIYAADGIRCAGFTRHERSVLPAQHDLTVFRLAVADDNVTLTINGSDSLSLTP